MKPASLKWRYWISGLLLAVGWLPATLRAAPELELKDETGKTIVKYVIEVPPGIAPAGVTDPTKQVGLILCSQEHDTPTGNDLFPVRQSLLRQGLLDSFVLLAPAPQGRKFGPERARLRSEARPSGSVKTGCASGVRWCGRPDNSRYW